MSIILERRYDALPAQDAKPLFTAVNTPTTFRIDAIFSQLGYTPGTSNDKAHRSLTEVIIAGTDSHR